MKIRVVVFVLDDDKKKREGKVHCDSIVMYCCHWALWLVGAAHFGLQLLPICMHGCCSSRRYDARRVHGDSRVVASRISKQEGPGSIPGGGKEV